MSLYTETITGLTTIFTPPAACSNSWTYEAQGYNSVSNGLLIQNLDQGNLDTSCFPSGFGMYGRAPSSIQVYSPGACPGGYTTRGEFNDGVITTGICCQSGFSYGSTYSSINYFGSTSVLFLGCISEFSGQTTVSARTNNTDLVRTVISGSFTMWGQPITVEYQQKDLSLFSATGTTVGGSGAAPSSSVATTALPTAVSGSSSLPTQTTVPQTTGLSTGAKAGIGVGVALGALILVALAVFLIMKRRRRRLSPSTPYSQEGKEPYRTNVPQELSNETSHIRGELDGQEAFPSSGVKRKAVPGYGPVSELE